MVQMMNGMVILKGPRAILAKPTALEAAGWKWQVSQGGVDDVNRSAEFSPASPVELQHVPLPVGISKRFASA
jgi:hypothetical protein